MFKPAAITATALVITAGGVVGIGVANQPKGNDDNNNGNHHRSSDSGKAQYGHGTKGKKAHRHFSALDQQFLEDAAMGNAYEVEAGKLAQSKSTTTSVTALGARLVADHTKALGQVTYIADRLSIDVEATPSPIQSWILKTLNATPSGATFDAQFLSLAVADHREDIEKYDYEARNGSHWAVRKYARESLPVLKMHLAAAQAAMGVTATAKAKGR